MKHMSLKATFCVSLLLLACFCTAHAQGRTATVISEIANLRESPSQTGEIKQEIPVGTKVKVLDQKGAWYVVRIEDQVGWIHGNTIRFGSSSANESSTPSDSTSTSPNNTSRPRRSDSTRTSDRTYTNVDGERVPSPVFTDSVPAGATAQCRDGSYSFSRHRRGTCSHHGGVARWL